MKESPPRSAAARVAAPQGGAFFLGAALRKNWLAKLMPDSLFGRLAWLLGLTVLCSHILALTLMFEMRPDMRPDFRADGPLPGPPAGAVHWGDAPPPPPPHHDPSDKPHHGGPPPVGLLVDIGVRLGALLLAAWVAARWLSDPIRRLAGAARELGHNIHRAPLPEAGSLECREATRVFNQMQQHIRAQLAQRDQFVAAVSHDLRTPLTRLALRVESLPDAAERQSFGRDIAEMDTMIRATLDYLRGAADAESRVPLDMRSLVESLVHDQQDSGHDVQLLEPAAALAPVRAQPSSLRRCIGNLLDNAVRYGGAAEVALAQNAEGLHVTVRDRGPGIPEDELEKVLEPFYRVESSRNRNTGGVGLGLASASDIARQHGGRLQLRNRSGGGLEATLWLPQVATETSLLPNQ